MQKVGFIGLGIMGKPMALRLHAAGVALTAYTRRVSRRDEVAAAGVTVASDARTAARDADVVFTNVSDTAAVEDVLFSASGIASTLKPGAVVVDMSTIDPLATREFARRLRDIRVAMLDAPVSGGEVGAIEGTLSIMIGGEAAQVEQVRPLFEHLGKNIVHVGGHGAGQIAKACNQLLVAQTLTAMAEAFTMARAAGVDPANVRSALLGGFAYSRALELHGLRMLNANYAPGFKTALHNKDLNIVLDTARKLGLALPGTALSAQWMNGAERRDPDADSSSIFEVISGANASPS